METTIQDLPGRTLGLGIPRSGSMDNLSFAIGNLLVGNAQTVEGLETVIVPGVGCAFQFYIPTVVAVTGKDVFVKINGTIVPMWSRLIVPNNGILLLEARPLGECSTGFRTYLCIRGGFPDVPVYLGSKSTSMGLGGYQVRSKFAYKVSSYSNSFPLSPCAGSFTFTWRPYCIGPLFTRGRRYQPTFHSYRSHPCISRSLDNIRSIWTS